MDKYEEIINIPHFEPKHKRMSLYSRSAQFAPFAALTGYEEAIEETGRETTKRIEIEEETKQIINEQLIKISNNLKDKPLIKVTYFVQDNKKEGGKYITIEGNVKKINEIEGSITLINNKKIKINEIKSIELIT